MLGREQLLETLMQLARRSGPRTRPELLMTTLRVALALGEADGAALLYGQGRKFGRLTLRANDAHPTPGDRDQPSPFERGILRVGQVRAVGDLAESRRALESGCPGVDAGPALFLPWRAHDRESGLLALYRKRGGPRFTARDARQFAVLVSWLGSALENVRLGENLERLAITDDLTQVYNYRYLKSALRREIKRAIRFRQQLSIVMIDVDNLKGYNDRNGHIRGSHLLREMAQLFATQVRSWDLVAKYGGDEFTVILPQTDRAGASTVAERLRASVEAHAFPLTERGTITVSLGIATLPDDGDTSATLIEASDRALYRAKRNGRNRVEGDVRSAA